MIRTLIIILVGIGSILILYFIGIRNYLNPYLSLALCGLLPVILKKEYLIFWISGSILFTVNYLLSFFLVDSIWPEFVLTWNFRELGGVLFLGIPLEEYLFAVLYGGSMGTCLAYVFDARFIPGKSIGRWLSARKIKGSRLKAQGSGLKYG